MARQPGMMAEQIAHRDAVGRDGVMQPEFRDVFPHRLLPIHAPLVHQERQARGGERLRDRADQELCVGCHRQAGFDIAKAIGPDERHLPVLHHRDGEARNLPFVHRFRDETFELGNEGRNGFAERDRLGCHRKGSSTGVRAGPAGSTRTTSPSRSNSQGAMVPLRQLAQIKRHEHLGRG